MTAGIGTAKAVHQTSTMEGGYWDCEKFRAPVPAWLVLYAPKLQTNRRLTVPTFIVWANLVARKYTMPSEIPCHCADTFHILNCHCLWGIQRRHGSVASVRQQWSVVCYIGGSQLLEFVCKLWFSNSNVGPIYSKFIQSYWLLGWLVDSDGVVSTSTMLELGIVWKYLSHLPRLFQLSPQLAKWFSNR